VRAAPADRPGDQQQEEEDAERQNSKGPGRNRQLGVLGLEERQSQGHTRSVAARSSWWVAQLVRALLPDLAGSGYHILARGHLRQTHRATRVQLLRGYPDLGPEPELTSIDEPA
jgi:hypothetical protein